MRNYIGVTAPDTTHQVGRLVEASEETDKDLRLGILVSDYVLKDGEDPHHSHYPKLDDVPRLLEASGDAKTAIHFNTHEPKKTGDQLRRALSNGDVYDRDLCRTVQLNMPMDRHLLDTMEELRGTHPDIRYITSIGSWTSDIPDDDVPETVASNLDDDGAVIIDYSLGHGDIMDVDASCELFTALRDAGYHGTIVLAGGLGPDNVRGVVNAAAHHLGHTDFSTDAQSGLRSGSEKRKETRFDLDRGLRYVDEAAMALAPHARSF